MKKLIFQLFLIVFISCGAKEVVNYVYSWNSLSSNQAVTFGDANDAVSLGIFTQVTSFSSSTTCMTKANAITYLNINTSYAPFAAKDSNRLIIKSDLQPNGYYSYVISQGYTSGNQCSGLGQSYQTVYAAESDWLSVTTFYSDSALTTPFVGNSLWYGSADAATTFGYGTTLRISNAGLITATFSC